MASKKRSKKQAPVSNAELVRRFLDANPEATNSELYAKFPKIPRPSLRRLAGSNKKVREKRGLKEPKYFKHPLAYAPKVDTAIRYKRIQISYERAFRYQKIMLPLTEDFEHLLKRIFSDCEDFVDWAGLRISLSTYILDVQIARGGTFGKKGKLKPDWENDFISIPNPNGLQKSTPRELWEAFSDFALQKINNMKMGELMLKNDIVSLSKSDPVFIRPARLRIFVHGP